MGDSLVSWIAIDGFNKGFAAVNYVYYGVIWMLFMSWCSAAYVVYSTVVAGISFTEGFYSIYADYSAAGNLMYFYEVLAIAALIFWALGAVILSLWAGSMQWKAMDDRLAEATNDSNGSGMVTPLRWSTGMSHFILSVLTGMTTMIAGVALGETAGKLIGYFDSYDDKTNDEACTDGDCVNDRHTAGEGTQNDMIAHLITVFYGIFVLNAISLGGFIFMMSYTSLDDEFDCEIKDGVDFNSYAGAYPYINSMTDLADCMTKIDSVFPFMDRNNDGFISRCEDATFMYVIGETREFAMKFSAPFTKDSFRKICEKRFPAF